ncbi:MAG: immunoglobulin domain-containing protein, partial [Fluviicola sp.]
MLKKITLILMLLSSISCYKAQTSLVPGDILFTSYNGISVAGVAPDTFSFVILTPITSNTVIYFTERGFQGAGVWQGGGTTEGTISWTSGTALSIGQEVVIAGIGAGAATVNGVPNGNVAIVAGGNVSTGLSLSNAGDQVIAFQGGAGDPTSGSATMISGISWALNCGTTTDGGWNGFGCTYGPQTSKIPPSLTGGTNAFLAGVAMATSNNSHGFFNCAGTPYSTVPAIKAALMNKANWTMSTSSTTVLNIPGGCNYYATCTNPTINTQPSNSTICLNGNSTFTIAATGATAFQWQLNTGSGFNNITNGGVYANATTATLNITGVTTGMNGYLYRCIATDGACSTSSSQATLTVSNPSLTALSQTTVSCFGGSNGAASVNAASGGISPYSYNWTPGNPTGDGTTSVTGLTAGTWTCTVTDANSCTASTNFTITQPTAITLTAASQTNV